MTSYQVPIRKKQTPKIASIDPGLRKFLSLYSPDGECSHIGTDCRERLWSHLQDLDRYDELLCREMNKKKRCHLQRKKRAVYRKMSDLKDELHRKTINHLVSEYGTIVLGKLTISDLIKREKRFLRTKEVRSILGLSHYQFRTRLEHRCLEMGVNYHLANEAWTSKTCTGCGVKNYQLGGSEHFSCACGVNIDRDLNGARNILLKSMGELDVLKHEDSLLSHQMVLQVPFE